MIPEGREDEVSNNNSRRQRGKDESPDDEEDGFTSNGRRGAWKSRDSDEYRLKVKIPSFNSNLDIESFLNWIYEVEIFFDVANISEEKHAKFMAYKLKRGEAAWWDQ